MTHDTESSVEPTVEQVQDDLSDTRAIITVLRDRLRAAGLDDSLPRLGEWQAVEDTLAVTPPPELTFDWKSIVGPSQATGFILSSPTIKGLSIVSNNKNVITINHDGVITFLGTAEEISEAFVKLINASAQGIIDGIKLRWLVDLAMRDQVTILDQELRTRSLAAANSDYQDEAG